MGAGAVNTVVRLDGVLYGDNTDWLGICDSVRSLPLRAARVDNLWGPHVAAILILTRLGESFVGVRPSLPAQVQTYGTATGWTGSRGGWDCTRGVLRAQPAWGTVRARPVGQLALERVQ